MPSLAEINQLAVERVEGSLYQDASKLGLTIPLEDLRRQIPDHVMRLNALYAYILAHEPNPL